MSKLSFDFEVLEEGTKKIVSSIQKTFPKEDLQYLILPDVRPGFIRDQLPEMPPSEGAKLQTLIEQTQQIICPGIMHWQSPKFFGYFPNTLAVTSCLAQLYSSVLQTPGFTFMVSPSQTELENVMIDWTGKALGLPEQFLFSGTGGGVINGSATESILVTVHSGKRRKMNQIRVDEDPTRIVKLVGYFSEFGVAMNERALYLKEIFHVRKIPASFNENQNNFTIDPNEFRKIVQKDVENGLIPFWYGMTFGTTFTNASDLTLPILEICKQYGMWIHVDAAYLGATLLCPSLRPDMNLIRSVDSFSLNFHKTLFVGMTGNVLFVKNREEFTHTLDKHICYQFVKKPLSQNKDVIDYKDWTLGFGRKFNSLKFFYLYRYYGLKALQDYIMETIEKRKKAEEIIKDSKIFEIFCTPQYGLLCFRLLDKDNCASNELTKILSERIKNIPEGFMSPGLYREYVFLRLSIGNCNSTLEVIERYLNKIIEVGTEIREQL